ncbi:uncharacterized protein LOC126735589 [Anthonomus grandis grandis]|uniref:uncharacterized protein LOC126735589 n=1 Tax=Anthonomus grandis grandis TaxID=2921223 RepID=UPI0021659FF8|nr:uncharacterized protein LOC126735589 [Anthonomus grandis grandis]
MRTKLCVYFFFSAYVFISANALPSSLVKEIEKNEVQNKKVKRDSGLPAEPRGAKESVGETAYFNQKPAVAIKRGIKPISEDFYKSTQGHLNTPLFWYNYKPETENSLAQYNKLMNFKDGNSKARNGALEMMKAELYGNPNLDHYRQYRPKRNAKLRPEEVLALLTLYEFNKNKEANKDYREALAEYANNYMNFKRPTSDSGYDLDESDNERWLTSPVNPHAYINQPQISDHLYDYELNMQNSDIKPHWANYDEKY